MSALTEISMLAMEDGEREILERTDERLARLDAWIETSANPALVELRAEVAMTRKRCDAGRYQTVPRGSNSRMRRSRVISVAPASRAVA